MSDELTLAQIESLRKAYRAKEPFKPSSVVRRFFEKYGLGRRHGLQKWHLTPSDQAQLRTLVKTLCQVDIAHDDLAALAGLSRDEMAQLTPNEKLTRRAVREGRVAVKALPGQHIALGADDITLPAGMSLDADWESVARAHRHDAIVVVENWVSFDRIHACTLDFSVAGANPLVLFRGSPVYSLDASTQLLRHAAEQGTPAWAYVDLDPAGLVIANALPGLAGLIAPAPADLEALLLAHPDYKHEAYLSQLPGAQQILDATTRSDIAALWGLLRRYGAAVPQEVFQSTGATGR